MQTNIRQFWEEKFSDYQEAVSRGLASPENSSIYQWVLNVKPNTIWVLSGESWNLGYQTYLMYVHCLNADGIIISRLATSSDLAVDFKPGAKMQKLNRKNLLLYFDLPFRTKEFEQVIQHKIPDNHSLFHLHLK
jgi:hypothetical protein